MRLTPLTRRVLAYMRDHPEGTYGMAIIKATGIKDGTLYPMLRKMLAAGLVADWWQPSKGTGKPHRHCYRLTDAGREAADG